MMKEAKPLQGHGDRYIGSLFRADESVPDDSLLGLRPRRWLSSSSVIGRVIRLYHDNSTTSLLTMVSLSSSGMSFVSITFYILISLYDRMSLRATFFLPIYGIASSTPKYLREKAYGGAVHDK